MFDNPRKSLRWMEDELLDEELEDILYGGEEDEDDEEYERAADAFDEYLDSVEFDEMI